MWIGDFPPNQNPYQGHSYPNHQEQEIRNLNVALSESYGEMDKLIAENKVLRAQNRDLMTKITRLHRVIDNLKHVIKATLKTMDVVKYVVSGLFIEGEIEEELKIIKKSTGNYIISIDKEDSDA